MSGIGLQASIMGRKCAFVVIYMYAKFPQLATCHDHACNKNALQPALDHQTIWVWEPLS